MTEEERIAFLDQFAEATELVADPSSTMAEIREVILEIEAIDPDAGIQLRRMAGELKLDTYLAAEADQTPDSVDATSWDYLGEDGRPGPDEVERAPSRGQKLAALVKRDSGGVK